MLMLRAVKSDMVVFRPFADSFYPRHYIFIIDLNLILNDIVTRKTWPFKKITSTPSYSVL